MEDTLTIIFELSAGPTPDGEREPLTSTPYVWLKPLVLTFDAAVEDMGVGYVLDDPNICAINVSWTDDYDDKHAPILQVTGLYYRDGESDDDLLIRHETNILGDVSIRAPYFERGTQIAEWVVNYMRDNTYYQDRTDTK